MVNTAVDAGLFDDQLVLQYDSDVLNGWWSKQRRRPARGWPSYLDFIYSWSKQNPYSVARQALENCGVDWRGKKGGDKRPLGCGDRIKCPLCADWYHTTMARWALHEVFEPLIEAAEDAGVKRESHGSQIVLTLPKVFSHEIDAIMKDDPLRGANLVNKLRSAGIRCIQKALAEQAGEIDSLGAVAVVHHWGSSRPWESHWHIHYIIAPYLVTHPKIGHDKYLTKLKDLYRWRESPRWLDDGIIEKLRASWKKAAQRIMKLRYEGDWNISVSYFRDGAQLCRNVHYNMRAPLRDLWQYTKGTASTGWYYQRPKGQALDLGLNAFSECVDRAIMVNRALKRVTWYGYLANASLKKSMASLGMVAKKVKDIETEVDKDEAQYWRPVSVTTLGVLFESRDGTESDFTPWNQLKPEPVARYLEKPIGVQRKRVWVRQE